MTAPNDLSGVSLERRLAVLRALPSFETLPADGMEELANLLGVERFAAGQEIVHESQVGDYMYLIEDGQVVVSAVGPTGSLQLGSLRAGEMFGEIALLSETRQRRATVTAETPVVTLTLSLDRFQQMVALYPEVKMDLACAASALMQIRLEALMQAQQEKMQGLANSPLSI